MRCQCRTPIRCTSRCARYCIPTAQTAPQADRHLRDPYYFPLLSQLTAHEKTHDSTTPSRSPQLSTLEEERALEIPSRSPQPPLHDKQRVLGAPSRIPQPPTHEEQRVSVKGRPVANREPPAVCASRRSDEKWENRRRRLNEERLEAQKLEVERRLEAQRKVKEAAVAAARSQSEKETIGVEHPSQRRFSGSDEEASRDQQHTPTVAIKVDDDKKVDSGGDTETVGASESEHDTGAIYLAITDEEHPESHLIMMAHVSHMCLPIAYVTRS